jgi:hypothetical protein
LQTWLASSLLLLGPTQLAPVLVFVGRMAAVPTRTLGSRPAPRPADPPAIAKRTVWNLPSSPRSPPLRPVARSPGPHLGPPVSHLTDDCKTTASTVVGRCIPTASILVTATLSGPLPERGPSNGKPNAEPESQTLNLYPDEASPPRKVRPKDGMVHPRRQP